MFTSEKQILQRLAVLVVCHGFAAGQTTSQYYVVQTPMSWVQARDFCQRHYVDLAVLSSEKQYFALLNAFPANKDTYWLGLTRQNISSNWMWVNGEELAYEHWYRKNYRGRCASLEARMEKDEKLLARYCEEVHMTVCQGPVSPQTVTVDSVGDDYVSISWTVSTFMLTTPHNYNVTICSHKCETLFYSYTAGSSVMNISISNLTSLTEYFIEISAFVLRPNIATGENVTLQNNSATLQVKTVWILYRILKKDDFIEEATEVSPLELLVEDTLSTRHIRTNRGFG
ncbi:uncharacterized protein LOC133450716 isoform X2 [Cololabis saira]|uniref:uncharacterized protein LOC133450716 isoform X2 n=1 Tax=Cololabis saira TaxID=129043 RepID=UPI002AD4F40E|nr:uncharacterized protein LOC133450716 isoform X2 [Cololabis saira]